MKKSLSQAIALATMLGAAATAQAAVTVEASGLGDALLYPLYTVENNNSTLVSVTNTTDEYKAVKIRFLEGLNSAEVLDFHLYMSPQDVWSGSIVATENGAKLMSKDTSCIVGLNNGFPKQGLEFRDFEIAKDGDKKELQSIARTRMGHFEVIEMGVLPADAIIVPAVGATPAVTAQAAIEHVNGKPGNCAALTTAWNTGGEFYKETVVGGEEYSSTTTQLTAPSGGLYGTAAIVNVPAAWAATYDATALKGTLGGAVQHPRPGTIYPHLLSGANPAIGSEADINDLSNQDVADVAKNLVSNVLLKSSLHNDYYVNPALNAETDLVVSYPTKRFHVNLTDKTDLDANGKAKPAAVAPFAQGWDGQKGLSCDPITVTYYDKEEASQKVDEEFISPLPPAGAAFQLCAETNVLSIGDSNIFGEVELDGKKYIRQSFDLAAGFNEGWLDIDLTSTVDAPNGLPVVGFSTITTKNGNAGGKGIMANFAQSFNHKYTK